MKKRIINKDVYDRVIKEIPEVIIKMLPEEPEKLLKYAKRVEEIQFSDGIQDNVKQLMKEHLLSDEEYLKTFYYIMAITFYKKTPSNNPKMNIVAAQTGSGKSNLTAKILRENTNAIFVDSDKYKHFRYDAQDISKNYPLLYPFLTGPDSYDHADNVYQYAIYNKYNIIKETAPSAKKGLLGKETEELLKNNYDISVNVLAVGKLNSLLSVHERYELQIINKLKTAKLTHIERHNESYNALIKNVSDIEKNVNISVYRRGESKNNFEPIKIYSNDANKNNYTTASEAIEIARKIDNEQTKKEFKNRYNLLIKQMNSRNAPKEQFEQLKTIYEEGR